MTNFLIFSNIGGGGGEGVIAPAATLDFDQNNFLASVGIWAVKQNSPTRGMHHPFIEMVEALTSIHVAIASIFFIESSLSLYFRSILNAVHHNVAPAITVSLAFLVCPVVPVFLEFKECLVPKVNQAFQVLLVQRSKITPAYRTGNNAHGLLVITEISD